jgi:hypothetical protein
VLYRPDAGNGNAKNLRRHYWYAPGDGNGAKMTLPQIYTTRTCRRWATSACELQWAAGGSGLFSMVVFIAVTWFIANIGERVKTNTFPGCS